MKIINNTDLALNALETTKIGFQKLVSEIAEEEMDFPSKITKRSIRGVIAHILISMEKAYPMLLRRARKQKPMPHFFGTKAGHYFSYKFSEYRGKQMGNHEAIVATYNKLNEHLITLVKEIQNDEWHLCTRLPKPNNRSLNILEIFTQQIPNHFDVHKNEVLQSLKGKE